MLIRHVHNSSFVENTVHEPVTAFVRSTHAWFAQATVRQTRYDGWFFGDETHLPHVFYKVLERISIASCAHTLSRSITLASNAVRFDWEDASFAVLPSGQTGLSIVSDHIVPFQLTLDMRGIYLTPGFDRHYAVEETNGGILITYTDTTLSHPLFLHIRGPVIAQSAYGTWQEADYARDAARHSYPAQLYVYELPPIEASRLDLGCGLTKDAAITASKGAKKSVAPSFEAENPGNEQDIARARVADSLRYLTTPQGIYAGLPWFHQFWSRDELLTALGLPEAEQLALIERYLALPLEKGELPTYLGSGTHCADGVGWLALLIKEYGLEKLSPTLRETVISFFSTALQQLNEHRRTPSGLIWSGHNATWMDTIGRTGFRLEIQCMYALVLQILGILTEDVMYEDLYREANRTIRHHFIEQGRLLDGRNDDMSPDYALRPNVFLAYLLQPWLLSPQEWETCWQAHLPQLETNWGGLTSLGTNDTAFQPHSTGEDNHSYHMGDSWFFVNNLTALALMRHGAPHFQKIAEKILASSTHEVLWQQFLGMHGEIASAADGASWGCGIQGFSAGGYLKALQG